MWSKTRTAKAYRQALVKFKYSHFKNVDVFPYEYDETTGQMKINPIPISVEPKGEYVEHDVRINIRILKQFLNKELKKYKFAFKHSKTNFDIGILMPKIALNLGITYGLNKLDERLREHEKRKLIS